MPKTARDREDKSTSRKGGAPAADGRQDLTGTYVFSTVEDGEKITMTLELKQDGIRFSGSLLVSPAPPDEAGGKVAGTMKGNVITLKPLAESATMESLPFAVSPGGRSLVLTLTIDGETRSLTFNKTR